MNTHNIMRLMPEVLAALKATGQNVSLAKDLEAAINHDRKGRGEPVQGERFLRAWVNLDKLPGVMMVGPEGRFGPVPSSTSCWITTSENEVERLKAKGPVLEVWTTPQSAQQSAPDGWKLVPVIPTEDMVVFGFESAPHQCFSPEDEWERYEAMSGCQQAAYRARKCWAAMLAAAPTPPNRQDPS